MRWSSATVVVMRPAFFVSFHGCLEAADALSDSFTQFGELFGPEHKQGNSENNQQMHRLKQSFKHTCSLDRVRNLKMLLVKMQAPQPVTR